MPEHQPQAQKGPQTTTAPQGVEAVSLTSTSSIGVEHLLQRAPSSVTAVNPAAMLQLQRTVGNRAVQRMLDRQYPDRRHPNRTSSSQSFVPPAVVEQTDSHPMRSMAGIPTRNIKQHTTKAQIQRAGNWDDFKNYTKGIWGKGGKFRNENEKVYNALDPSEAFASQAQNGGMVGQTGYGMAKIGHLGLSGLFGLGSLAVRGIETLGAGAYYGAKGLGGGLMSAGRSIGRGASRVGNSIGRGATRMGNSIKDAYNKDRNPHGYNRERLPTAGKAGMELGKPGLA